MSVSVIASLGTSPPVVTEFISWIAPVENVDRLILLATSDPGVLAGAELIKAAIKLRYPHIVTKSHILKISDILSEEDNMSFIEEVSKILAREKKDPSRRMYICLAGGRKEMVTSLMLLAQVFGVDGVFHVVSPYIREMNIELEKARRDIATLYESDDPLKFYEEHKEIFDKLMFPDKSTYNVVKIPIIPYPADLLKKLMLLAERRSLPIEKIGLTKSYLARLAKAGLIHIAGKKVIISDELRKLLSAISSSMSDSSSEGSPNMPVTPL